MADEEEKPNLRARDPKMYDRTNGTIPDAPTARPTPTNGRGEEPGTGNRARDETMYTKPAGLKKPSAQVTEQAASERVADKEAEIQHD